MSNRRKIEDDERVWQAMLAIFPAVINQDLRHAPQGCAQICHEHALALVNEWKKIRIPPSNTESPKGAENG